MKLDIKSVWTICPSTINFVLPFSTFDLSNFLQTRTGAKAYHVIATQRAKPDVRLPHGYTASKCPSWSHSICQWTASQAKEILTTNPGYNVLKLIVLVLVRHLDKLCNFLLQVTQLPVTTNKVSELFALINFIRLIHSTVPVCLTKSFRVGHCFYHNSLLRLGTAYQISLVQHSHAFLPWDVFC